MPKSQPEPPLTYSVEETSRLLKIGRNQGYEAVRTGEIPSIRIGKRILVPRAALDRLLSQPISKPANNASGD
jgi:excisionase family DNA binding protein